LQLEARRKGGQEVEQMNGAKANGRNLGQDARMVMHEDEHVILKEILRKTLGDDDCFAKVVSCQRSEDGRAEDRLVLARFLERMERQFALRAEERAVRSTEHDRTVVVGGITAEGVKFPRFVVDG
jgi:hypothetical protein